MKWSNYGLYEIIFSLLMKYLCDTTITLPDVGAVSPDAR